MGAYKTYAWEKATFPKLHKINIKPEFRIPLTRKIAAHFGVKNLEVSLNTSGGGWCRKTFWGYQISLGRPSVWCHLSTILHEIAHAYSHENEGSVGHSKKFKHNLIKINVESWSLLPGIFRTIRQELALENLAAEAKVQSEIRKAQKLTILKNFKKSYDYRIAHLKNRIKRLERKEKSIGTRLKSARRSLNTLERLQRSKTANLPIPVNEIN